MLRSSATVASIIARLGDVADVSGPGAESASRLRVADVTGLAPITIDPSVVRSALNGSAWATTAHITGTCQLRRAVRTITVPELIAAATAVASTAGGEVVTSVLREPMAVSIPDDGQVPVVTAEPLDRRQLGSTAYRLRVMNGEYELARSLVVLQVQRWRSALVAARSLKRGEILEHSDLRSERIAVSRSAAEPLDDPAAIVGTRLRRDLAPGTILAATDLQRPAAVAGGSSVELLFTQGLITVTTTGQALAEADIGGTVAVRRGDGRTIHGTVIAPGRVQVGNDRNHPGGTAAK